MARAQPKSKTKIGEAQIIIWCSVGPLGFHLVSPLMLPAMSLLSYLDYLCASASIRLCSVFCVYACVTLYLNLSWRGWNGQTTQKKMDAKFAQPATLPQVRKMTRPAKSHSRQDPWARLAKFCMFVRRTLCLA